MRENITFTVWRKNVDISWHPDLQIPGINRGISNFITQYFGSPYLLFRIRTVIQNELKQIPFEFCDAPIIEFALVITSKAEKYLNETSHLSTSEISEWLSDQFASSQAQLIVLSLIHI